MIPLDQRACVGSWELRGAPGPWPASLAAARVAAWRVQVPRCKQRATPASVRVCTRVLLPTVRSLLSSTPAGSKRLHSGSKVKSLSAVLGLGPGPPSGPGGRPSSHMPLAVIVDDRVEVRLALGRFGGDRVLACMPAGCAPVRAESFFPHAACPTPYLPHRRCGTRPAAARCCRWSHSVRGRSRPRRTAACPTPPPCRCVLEAPAAPGQGGGVNGAPCRPEAHAHGALLCSPPPTLTRFCLAHRPPSQHAVAERSDGAPAGGALQPAHARLPPSQRGSQVSAG